MNHIYGDENPYQPPKVELGVIESAKVSGVPRPASSYWLMTLFALNIITWGMRVRIISREFGVSIAGFNFQTLSVAAATIGILALLLGAKQSWGYRVAALILAVHLIGSTVSYMTGFSELWAFSAGYSIFVTIVILLKCWLFHRFTFGLPSRRYYGLVKE